MALLDELFGQHGRVAVVTGASSGLGRSIAEALASAGAAVVLVARDRARLDVVAAAVVAQGGSAATLPADLADRAEVARCADAARRPFGDPDILVNAAGVNRRPPLDQLTPAEWDETLAINLTAPFLLAQALVPAMLDRGWGRVINVTSMQAERAFGRSGAYGVSKAGLAQLSRAQAEAWSARGVNCNSLAPGFFVTPMTAAARAEPGRAEALAARSFIGRNGLPEDIRGAALFLASRASDFVTGQTLRVDGGLSAG
jgi:gluconate 5-dehydrogenase